MAQSLTAVLGAGAWGTALAVILARKGMRTVLCARRPSQLRLLEQERCNSAYLPGVPLPENLKLTDRWTEATASADTVVMAVPSRYARASMAHVAPGIRRRTTVVSATKGIEEGSLATMTAMLTEVLPHSARTAVLSGPGFAAEIARGKPGALVVASLEESVAMEVQSLFAGPRLRIYSSRDVIGVEISGAAKNVIAIAAGISDGLRCGSSARAALITRGLAEIARLVGGMGGRSETVAGLAGLGDLVLTCTGPLSRNRTVGIELAQGRRPGDPDTFGAGRSVAEGVTNTRSFVMLGRRLGVELPIASAVYRTLYEGRSPEAMVDELLSRGLKAEY